MLALCHFLGHVKKQLAIFLFGLGYDRKKYAAMLREAFEPFVLCLPKTAEENLLNDSLTEEELKRFPLFAALTITRS